MTDDFYDLLGVERDASQEEIRKAFREQVRQYHPDLNDDPRAPAQFTALKKAYDTLGDAKERDDYERMGHESYVAKRINGLPSPDEWEIPEKENGTGPGDVPGGSGGVGAGTTAGQSSAGRQRSDEDGRTTSSTGTRSNRSRTSGNARTRPGGRNGDRSSSNDRRRASAGGADQSSGGRSGSTGTASAAAAGTSAGAARHAGDGRVNATNESVATRLRAGLRQLRRVSLGWPLIILSDTLYVLGLIFYLAANETGAAGLVSELRTAVQGSGSIWAVFETTHGITPLSEYIVADVAAGTPIGGPLLILGMAFIPSVYFFVIRETRRIRTPWQPSYLYVLGALGPIVGLVLTTTLSTPGLYVEVVCYFLLPLLVVLALPFSAFLRPRIRRAIRRTIRRYR